MNKAFAFLAVLLTAAACGAVPAQDSLTFNPDSYTTGSLTLPTGKKVAYKAYEKLYFVANVEDSTYQYMNVYVPEGASQKTPILLRTYVGGYMASEAAAPQAGDASGRALAEGYVVAIPGSRGRNSKVGGTWTGRAPAAILDLKAAIRYLRHFDRQMPGDAERIITDGTSAGGAMSALMGATGNHPAYEPLLEKMGAAKERDDVFASVCFCPIIDLEHADMAYEWLFKDTDSRQSGSEEQRRVSAELAAQFPKYLESLNLFRPDGTQLTGNQLTDAIRQNVYLMNPMNFAGNKEADNAPHWYVRHGARDRDTAFPVPVIFATKLQNASLDVDFLLAWNRPHSGDYSLDEVFAWIARITQ